MFARATARRRRNEDLRLDLHEIVVFDDADDPTGGRNDGKVANAPVEHVQQDLTARSILGTVNAGAVITADTGESTDSPPATTLDRRSLSVTMPTESPRSTTRAVAPAAVIRFAASRIDVLGSAHDRRGSDGGAHRLSELIPRRFRRTVPIAGGAGPQGAGESRNAVPRPGQHSEATSAGIRYVSVSSAARASKPGGRPDSIDAWPNISPGPMRSRTRPSLTTSTAPDRITRRNSTASAPLEKMVVPAGRTQPPPPRQPIDRLGVEHVEGRIPLRNSTISGTPSLPQQTTRRHVEPALCRPSPVWSGWSSAALGR